MGGDDFPSFRVRRKLEWSRARACLEESSLGFGSH